MKRIDDLNRTERYFTSTLLPSLLFNDNLKGTLEFLHWLSDKKELYLTSTNNDENKILMQKFYQLPEHIEIITELNIKRELYHYGLQLNDLEKFNLSNKQNVPDIIIIFGNILIVIEGKFFVERQSFAFIDSQLKMQKEEINIIIDYLKPQIKYYSHIFLGPNKLDELSNCDLKLTWKDIEEFSISLLGKKHYISQRLINANVRYSEMHESIGNRINYSSACQFSEIIELCETKGNEILVGFQGGERKLIVSSMQDLQYRKFKWDNVNNLKGKKERKNWLPGDVFLMRINEISSNSSINQTNRIINKRSKNYAGKAGLSEIISLCNKFGKEVQIGFSGGKNILLNTAKEKIRARIYKYDFIKNSTGKKNKSNWINGEEFIKLLAQIEKKLMR